MMFKNVCFNVAQTTNVFKELQKTKLKISSFGTSELYSLDCSYCTGSEKSSVVPYSSNYEKSVL